MEKVFCHKLFLDALHRKGLNTNTFSIITKISPGTIGMWKTVKNIKKRDLIEKIEKTLNVKYDDLCVYENSLAQARYDERREISESTYSDNGLPLTNTVPVSLLHTESEQYDHKKEWPVIGTTRGGEWLETIESGYAGVADSRVSAPSVIDANGYALKIIGDSMVPEFTENGIVLVSPNSNFTSGDYAVVIIESRLGDRRESCVKQVFKHEDHITLHSVNSKYRDIDIPNGEVIAIHKIVAFRATIEKLYK